MSKKQVRVANVTIGRGSDLALISGPCVIESEALVMDVAGQLKEICARLKIPFIFKASFDKANRTSRCSFRGPGLKEGLSILEKIKKTYNVPIITDVHEPWHCEPVSLVVDAIQIPAFLARQSDLLIAAAKTMLPINVKKAQFMSPWDMINVVDKIRDIGNDQILLCERGSCFGYNRLIVDMCSLPIMAETGCPIVFDATHSVQKPSAKDGKTDGDRRFVAPLMRAAVAVGVDAIFLEAHPNPDLALSDGPNMLKLDTVEAILKRVLAIHNASRDET